MIRQPELASTLRAIAKDGPRAFYEGEFARLMANHLRQGESVISESDFSSYEATVEDALATPYGDAVFHSTGKATGGTTISESLRLLAGFDIGSLDPRSPAYLHVLAECFKTAFADRFAYLADPDKQECPWEMLLDPGYIESRRARDRSVTSDTRSRGGSRRAWNSSLSGDVRSRLHQRRQHDSPQRH